MIPGGTGEQNADGDPEQNGRARNLHVELGDVVDENRDDARQGAALQAASSLGRHCLTQ